jgi:hypothetical protein
MQGNEDYTTEKRLSVLGRFFWVLRSGELHRGADGKALWPLVPASSYGWKQSYPSDWAPRKVVINTFPGLCSKNSIYQLLPGPPVLNPYKEFPPKLFICEEESLAMCPC